MRRALAGARERITPALPRAAFALPWDEPLAPDPVAALAAARAELGDTFVVHSGDRSTMFVFGSEAVGELYALPENVASKGLAVLWRAACRPDK